VQSKKWQIGDASIESIYENVLYMPLDGAFKDILPDVRELSDEEKEWLIPDYCTPNLNVKLAIQSFLVRYQGKNILIDTGMNHPGPYEFNLKAAGCAPEDINYVMFTHMHYDHVGRNTRTGVFGTVAPCFPNARYLFPKESYEFVEGLYKYPERRKGNPEYDQIWPYLTQMLPLVEMGMVDFVDYDFTLLDIISLYPMPGHQPGQVGVIVNSKGEKAFICGDIAHHPIQMAQLDVSAKWDHDQKLSAQIREKVYGELAGTDTLYLGGHFMHGGFVEKTSTGYKFIKDECLIVTTGADLSEANVSKKS